MNFKEVLEIARSAHAGQKRWDGEDYIQHPIRIAEAFSDVPENDVIRQAALLHDSVEDNPAYTFERLIELGVSLDVVTVVKALTHKVEETYAEYLERLAKNPVALEIKLADIKDNCGPLPSKHQRRQKYEVAKLYLEHVKRCKSKVAVW